MILSAYLQNLIADWLRGVKFPAAVTSLKVALSLTVPALDGSNLCEPSDAGYARQSVILLPAEDGVTSNKTTVSFKIEQKTLDIIRAIVLLDQNGNILTFDAATSLGDDLALVPGDIQLRVGGSAHLASAVIDWMRGIPMPSTPSELLVELAPNIDRRPVRLAAPILREEIGTVLTLAKPVTFGPASEEASTEVTYSLVVDQDGNELFRGDFASPLVIPAGETLTLDGSTVQLLIR